MSCCSYSRRLENGLNLSVDVESFGYHRRPYGTHRQGVNLLVLYRWKKHVEQRQRMKNWLSMSLNSGETWYDCCRYNLAMAFYKNEEEEVEYALAKMSQHHG
jgi:hypothetical protein